MNILDGCTLCHILEKEEPFFEELNGESDNTSRLKEDQVEVKYQAFMLFIISKIQKHFWLNLFSINTEVKTVSNIYSINELIKI